VPEYTQLCDIVSQANMELSGPNHAANKLEKTPPSAPGVVRVRLGAWLGNVL